MFDDSAYCTIPFPDGSEHEELLCNEIVLLIVDSYEKNSETQSFSLFGSITSPGLLEIVSSVHLPEVPLSVALDPDRSVI